MSDSPQSDHQSLDPHHLFFLGLAVVLLAIMAVMLWYSANDGAAAPLSVKYIILFVTLGDFTLLLALYDRQEQLSVRRQSAFCEKNESATVITAASIITVASFALILGAIATWFQKL